MKTFAVTCCSLLFLNLAFADVRLPGLFSDHLVIQRDKPVNVWGWADVDESVSVSFGGATQTTKAGPDGKWMVQLPAQTVSDQPQVMTVKGNNERQVHH